MTSLRSTFCFLIFCTCLIISISSLSHQWSKKNHVALFIFGDSLFDAGNNNYLKNAAGRANFWPYGETFFKYPTGRFSDGRVISDFIAEYLKLPLISPYLQPGDYQFMDGVNFASGGAGALVETYQGMVIDLKTQLNYFKNVEKQLRQKLGESETKTLLSRAIYLFSIGTNDYLEPSTKNSSLLQFFSREEYVGMVIGNLTTVIKEIYKIGGRKFGFLSLLALGSIPFVRAREQNSPSGLMEEVTALAELHNKALYNCNTPDFFIYYYWVSCRYPQFAEIRQLSGSVNFRPDRPATGKVSELDRDFGYPPIVRRPECFPEVGIGKGEPGQPSSSAQPPQ